MPASSSARLAGGKGVPETVSTRPCVFATLTAASSGPVHSRRMRGKTVLPCRPRRDASKLACPHGRDISCPVRHAETDPRLGRPMCQPTGSPGCRNSLSAGRSTSCWLGGSVYELLAEHCDTEPQRAI